MNNKRYPTRMHEVLGVEPGEQFKIIGSQCIGDFCISDDGRLQHADTPGLACCRHDLEYAINHGIIRKPRLSEEQARRLRALVTLGAKYLVKDENGALCFAKAKEYLGTLYRELFLTSEWWKDSVEFKNTTLPILSALGTAMSAIEECQERELSCWYCGGIEDHDIEYVIAYEDKLNRRISAPYKVPSNFCANCGRKLKK